MLNWTAPLVTWAIGRREVFVAIRCQAVEKVKYCVHRLATVATQLANWRCQFKLQIRLLIVWLLAPLAALPAAEHLIRPGESPQMVLDRAAKGDRLVFLPGVHEHGLGKHRAILYVDKSVEIELREGAVLKLAPEVCRVEPEGEITTDQDAGKKLDDLESFDAENITIVRTRTINPNGAAYLLGHPSHRGQLRNVKCNHNYMETGKTALEPNFNLDGYEVIGNVIKSDGQAIHCWRHSKNGVIADNLRIHDNSGKPVVVVNAPRGWQAPDPPVLRNNRNHLSDEEEKKTSK